MATLTFDSRLSLQRIVTNACVHRKQGAELRTISGVPEVVVGLGDKTVVQDEGVTGAGGRQGSAGRGRSTR